MANDFQKKGRTMKIISTWVEKVFVAVCTAIAVLGVNADTLVIDANPKDVAVTEGRTLAIDSITYAEGFDETIAITKSGEGTLVLSGDNSAKFAGLTVNGGAVQISALSNLGSGHVVLSGGGLKITESISQGSTKKITVNGTGFLDIAEGKTFTGAQSNFIMKNASLTQKGKGTFLTSYWNSDGNVENGTWIVAEGGTLFFEYSWRGGFSNWKWLTLDIREGGTFMFTDVSKVHNVTLKGGRIRCVNPKTRDTRDYEANGNRTSDSLPELDDFSPKSRGVALCGKVTVLPRLR